jgi:hypothetical protein
MKRAQAVQELLNGQYQAIKVTQLLSNLIADELAVYKEYVQASGDLYGLSAGLIKAEQIARNYNPEETVEV